MVKGEVTTANNICTSVHCQHIITAKTAATTTYFNRLEYSFSIAQRSLMKCENFSQKSIPFCVWSEMLLYWSYKSNVQHVECGYWIWSLSSNIYSPNNWQPFPKNVACMKEHLLHLKTMLDAVKNIFIKKVLNGHVWSTVHKSFVMIQTSSLIGNYINRDASLVRFILEMCTFFECKICGKTCINCRNKCRKYVAYVHIRDVNETRETRDSKKFLDIENSISRLRELETAINSSTT